MEGLFEGFKIMLYPLSTVVAGFMLKDINDASSRSRFAMKRDLLDDPVNKTGAPMAEKNSLN